MKVTLKINYDDYYNLDGSGPVICCEGVEEYFNINSKLCQLTISEGELPSPAIELRFEKDWGVLEITHIDAVKMEKHIPIWNGLMKHINEVVDTSDRNAVTLWLNVEEVEDVD